LKLNVIFVVFTWHFWLEIESTLVNVHSPCTILVHCTDHSVLLAVQKAKKIMTILLKSTKIRHTFT